MVRIPVIVMAIAPGLLIADLAYSQEKADRRPRMLHGTVASVDSGARTVTVQSGHRRQQKSLTVEVPENCPVVVDGKAGQFSDIQSGQRVLVQLESQEGQKLTAARIGVRTGAKPEPAPTPPPSDKKD